MRRLYSLLFVLILISIIGVLAYIIGRKSVKPVNEIAISNTTFIKEIAELAALEVHGNASFKHTNIQNDGSFGDAMRKLFLENTINIAIPYIAKYGVNLQTQEISQNTKDSIVTIYLPKPQLLSYELRMDQADALSKKGWFESENTDQYLAIQKKLYTSTRTQIENNQTYIKESEQKIRAIIEDYYKPLHMKANVIFDKPPVSLTDEPNK